MLDSSDTTVLDSPTSIVFDLGDGEFSKTARVRDNGIAYKSFGLLCERIIAPFLLHDYPKFDAKVISIFDEYDVNPHTASGMKYKTLPLIIRDMNPTYSELAGKSFDEIQDIYDQAFDRAVSIAVEYLISELLIFHCRLHSKDIIIGEASNSKFKNYIELTPTIPYQGTLDDYKDIHWVLSMSTSVRGAWQITAITNSRPVQKATGRMFRDNIDDGTFNELSIGKHGCISVSDDRFLVLFNSYEEAVSFLSTRCSSEQGIGYKELNPLSF